MRKVISIGESVLDTVFVNRQPVKAMVGGRIAKRHGFIRYDRRAGNFLQRMWLR